jgi:hypothetical protein
MHRLIKYLLLVIGLPAIGFITMYLVRPLTSGAHDSGFLGMILGLVIAQVFFAIWFLEVKWYFSFLIGLIIGVATVSVSFWLLWELRGNYYPEGNPYGIDHDEALELKIRWIFFLILVPTAMFIFEIMYQVISRFMRPRDQKILSKYK